MRSGRKPSTLLRSRQVRPAQLSGSRSGLEPVLAPALVVGVWLFAAAVLAPERPQDQAAICQRHNGPEACRVW